MPRTNTSEEKPQIDKAVEPQKTVIRRTDLPTEVVGRLVSRLSHPVTVQYNGTELRITPRAETTPHIIKGLLGTLPAGVMFVAN